MDRRATGSRTGLLLAVLLAWAGATSGQTVRLSLDTQNVVIGGQFRAALDVLHDPMAGSVAVEWPAWPDTLGGGIEVLSVFPLDTGLEERMDGSELIRIRQAVLLTAWDTGRVAIDPIGITLDGVKEASNAAFINVVTHPNFRGEEPAPQAGLIAVDWTFWERFRMGLPWVFAVLGAGLLAWGMLRWLSRRSKVQDEEPAVIAVVEEPLEPADVEALAALGRIREAACWRQGQVKRHYVGTSDVVRRYVERRFGFPALERTTWEIEQHLPALRLEEDAAAGLRYLLQLSDHVKFAKYKGSASDHERVIERAIDFVRKTTPSA